MSPKIKINLKERVDDGELDLSMSDLQEVPIKDICAVKKVTGLDLSNNRLTVLGKNFTSMTFLIKLDLSKNLLKELPEDFGSLKQLKHLDLYANELTHLPLSFSELKMLKWLDLKDNPLVPAVFKVAGPCLDRIQCQRSAKDVVAFFSQMKEHIEVEREKREIEKQQQLEAEENLLKDKLKKREKKKAQRARKFQERNEVKPEPQETKITKIREIPQKQKIKQEKPKHKKKSVNLCRLIRLCLSTWFMMLVSLFLLSTSKVEYVQNINMQISASWNAMIQATPENVQPYLMQLGMYVASLHRFSGIAIEEILIAIQKFRESDAYRNGMEILTKACNFALDESVRWFHYFNERLMFWGNEAWKKIL